MVWQGNTRLRLGKPNQYWLLVFVVIAPLLDHQPGISPPIVFLAATLGIVPIAHLISESTERLATYTGDTLGGLLNVIFGNLPELIIGVVALQAGLYAMVIASLVGAILFNLLLVLGLSFLLSGLRRHTLEFNARAASVYSSMMFIAVLSLALPSIYQRTFTSGDILPERESVSIGLAVVLLALYGLYLSFGLRTHPEIFASVRQAEIEEHGSHWSLARCITTLVLSSVVAAVLSEILVGAVEGTGEMLGLSTAFLGVVLLASVGGAAEGVSAVRMAWKGRIDLSLSIALGSCILIALFIAPVFVFASYLIGPEHFNLSFTGVGITLLFLAVLIAAIVVSGGAGNWYKGVQLITVYTMIALLLYYIPE